VMFALMGTTTAVILSNASPNGTDPIAVALTHFLSMPNDWNQIQTKHLIYYAIVQAERTVNQYPDKHISMNFYNSRGRVDAAFSAVTLDFF